MDLSKSEEAKNEVKDGEVRDEVHPVGGNAEDNALSRGLRKFLDPLKISPLLSLLLKKAQLRSMLRLAMH